MLTDVLHVSALRVLKLEQRVSKASSIVLDRSIFYLAKRILFYYVP